MEKRTVHSFKRDEKLKSEKVIGQLFKNGKSFGQYPLRLVWSAQPRQSGAVPVLFAVSVPRRKFPKAVQRNRLKRLVREAYRTQKYRLFEKLTDEEQQYAFMVLYVAKEVMSYKEIELAMKIMLKRFLKKK